MKQRLAFMQRIGTWGSPSRAYTTHPYSFGYQWVVPMAQVSFLFFYDRRQLCFSKELDMNH